MAIFEDSMKIQVGLEFSNPSNALETNATENGYTYMGIYQTANPSWSGWDIINQVMSDNDGLSLRDISKKLYAISDLTEKVYDFYYATFWKPYRLSEIEAQHKADELFVFGCNAGMKRAIKCAQDLVGVTVDGIIGSQTIQAINNFDYSLFDKEFDDEEIEYYKSLVQANPAKSIFLNGWINRAKEV